MLLQARQGLPSIAGAASAGDERAPYRPRRLQKTSLARGPRG